MSRVRKWMVVSFTLLILMAVSGPSCAQDSPAKPEPRVLKGRGEMLLADGRSLEMKEGLVLDCPPDTEHDVKSLGDEPLRYIYVVTKTR